ncbi:unnamed protein product [Callosobruchus maculatus]|uniref:Uncharacterized protein n=1 Tax=Callosobruchus maculatus TaxID=64391 RepID=A0A653D0Q0_CALMS|nr:unnamed protein product [Callosobruchus maculatus]
MPSRRHNSSQRRTSQIPQHSAPSDNNPYQGTTLPLHHASSSQQHHRPHHTYHNSHRPAHHGYAPPLRHHSSRRHRSNGGGGGAIDRHAPPVATTDGTDGEAYNYCCDRLQPPARQNGGYALAAGGGTTDVSFTEDTDEDDRLPYLEFEDESNKRYSRNTFSDRSFKRPKHSSDKKYNHYVNKDLRRVYPNHDSQWDQIYQEIQTPCDNVPVTSASRKLPTRLSDRPQSSMSSGVTSAVVYGCGGKCQTFENVCYFFLQLVFTMGILTGVSLCIAGAVLRRSAARNLQVLAYIGGLLALVSALLLAVQCEARHAAHARRRKRMQLAQMRQQIRMEEIRLRTNPMDSRRESAEEASGSGSGFRESVRKANHLPSVHGNANINRPLPLRPTNRESSPMIEEQGIPWWRRKDLEIRQ